MPAGAVSGVPGAEDSQLRATRLAGVLAGVQDPCNIPFGRNRAHVGRVPRPGARRSAAALPGAAVRRLATWRRPIDHASIVTRNQPAIRLQGVTKRFGDVTAVEDLDLAVPAGSIYGLLGPNGAGKTTTIRIVLDILGPDEGTVQVFGSRVGDDTRDRIGYLPEERGLYKDMKVADHLAFLGTIKGLDHGEAEGRARDWLERLELAGWADDRVEDLSKGMQQKVQFISTVLHDPDLLILDEPFSGLDPINVDVLKDIVLEEARQGTTILFSTHMIEDAERLCERVCMIAGARKVLDGTVAEVKAEAGGRNVALAFDGDRGFLDAPELVAELHDRGRHVEVKVAEGASPQELLQRALEAGARIERFELVEPSLRQIFLERAGRRGLEVPEEERDPGRQAATAAAGVESAGDRRP